MGDDDSSRPLDKPATGKIAVKVINHYGDEVLNLEIFDTLLEAKVLIERWRREYNHVRPHSSLGYRPPAPEAILPGS